MTGNPRLLVIFTFATFLVLGGVVSLATDEWWWLILAVALHAIGTGVTLGVLGKALGQQDKPDPVEEAALEEREQEGGDRPAGGSEREVRI